MTSTLVDCGAITVDSRLVDDLRTSLRGQLLIPGQNGYDEARSVWNAMIDRRPALIARCLGSGDVLTCVNFAREHGLTLSIKGSGHNISGLAVCNDGLMLDMSLMRGVWVNSGAGTARAQAGCLLGDMDRETQLHGLAAVLGFISTTGIASLTLGGGFGYLTRRHGWSCDNLLSIDLVTADGRLMRASEDALDDLFWALRGGGGNFGVATSFEYKLYPVGPEVVAGAIAWRAEDAPDVLDMYRTFTAQAPPDLTSAALLRRAPPVPWLPRHIHGQSVIALVVCHTGPVSEAEHQIASIKAFGAPLGDIVQRRTYVSQQSLVDGTQPKGRRYYWKSEYLPRLEPELRKSLEHAEHIESPHSAIALSPFRARSTGCRPTIRRSAIGAPRGSSTSWLRGKRPKETRRISSGLGQHGRTCADSRPAAPMSTSRPRRKERSASMPRMATTTGGSLRSRGGGIQTTCSE